MAAATIRMTGHLKRSAGNVHTTNISQRQHPGRCGTEHKEGSRTMKVLIILGVAAVITAAVGILFLILIVGAALFEAAAEFVE